jgi:hypothetical protein
MNQTTFQEERRVELGQGCYAKNERQRNTILECVCNGKGDLAATRAYSFSFCSTITCVTSEMKRFLLVCCGVLAIAMSETSCSPVTNRKPVELHHELNHTAKSTVEGSSSSYYDSQGHHDLEEYESNESDSAYSSPPAGRGRGKEAKKKRVRVRDGEDLAKLRVGYRRREDRKAKLGLGYREPYKPEQQQPRIPPEFLDMSAKKRERTRREWLELPAEGKIPTKYKGVSAILIKLAHELRAEAAANTGGRVMSVDEALRKAEELDDLEDAGHIQDLLSRRTPVREEVLERTRGKGKAPSAAHAAALEEDSRHVYKGTPNLHYSPRSPPIPAHPTQSRSKRYLISSSSQQVSSPDKMRTPELQDPYYYHQ